MAVIYSKCPLNVPTFSILRPSKIYPIWNIWFENTCTIWQPWLWMVEPSRTEMD
jgi:hypothetical protein